ncbi:unnamed protein product [Euphydryas editha]|uniref:Reverse transcriptase domain-containing protein n=1 Tax=Euphydryas editha TaxID=104508 RepID=A0AAU9V3X6_EUPED|nr:unnamed protein product [Euphydryas editha]
MKTEKQKDKRKLNKIFTQETLSLIKQRHKLQNSKPKSHEDKMKLSSIYKETNKSIRKDYKNHRLKTIEEHLRTSSSYKRAFKELHTHKTWIPSLLENSTPSTNRENILKIATNFYANLYDQRENENSEIITFHPQNKTNIEWNATEIVREINRLKSNKSPGPDGIPNEALKLGQTLLTPTITTLFNTIIKEERVPEQWTKSNIILLYKKGDPNDIGNYRPISLLPSLYKLFSQCILSRISTKIDKNQPVEQAGFRKGFSTVDHIQTLESVIEKYKELQRPLYLAFIDYQKAFDSISHNSIWEALKVNNIDSTYCNVIKNIYERSTSKISLETSGPEIKIKRGVKQGDSLSPKLFIAVLEMIFKRLKWENLGILINNEYLSHLRFADDIILFSESISQLENMIEHLQLESVRVGLEMNMQKTKLMTNSLKSIKIRNENLEYVDTHIYLGKQVSFHRNNLEEINRRINMTWQKYWAHKEIIYLFIYLFIQKSTPTSSTTTNTK